MKIENSKLKIGINGYFLSRPFTGFGVYTIWLLKALSKIADPSEWEFIVFTPEKPKNTFKAPVKIVVIPQRKSLGASLAKIYWEQFQIISSAKKHRVRLLHHFYPSTAVLGRGLKQIVSIHDATPWHFDEHSIGLKIKMLRKFMIWSNKKALRVISVSNYGRDDVSNIYQIPKNKIDVIYNGIDGKFREQITKSGIDRITKKYEIQNPYIFYIGGFEIHKNVRRLIEAYAKVKDTISQDLIIAGGVFSKSRLGVYKDYFDLPDLMARYQLEGRVKMIGVVPDEDLPALYKGADLYIMPSLAEGFNLPLVQAFASKTPSIASDTLASREIAGNATYLVDGTSSDAIASGIIRVLGDKKLQENLIAKGVRQQSQFLWENSGERLLSFYSQILH